MENASKALIIAGAILLAILLISLGIMIFNQAQDTVNNSGMSQAEITAFNNKFLKYEGAGKTGSEVKSLLNEVISSNADANNSKRIVAVTLDTKTIISSQSKTKDTSAINTTGKYDVEMNYCNTGNERKNNDTLTIGCIYLINIIKID